MSTRWQLTTVALCLILAAPSLLHADIYRWDNGQVIPGTEGITPRPGVQLDHRTLAYANLGGLDLTEADWEASDLTGATLAESTLTNANLRGANLTGANLTGANLTSVRLYSSKLTNANLTGANLTNAWLGGSTLTSANLTGAVVTGADFGDTTGLFEWGGFGFTREQLYSTQSYQTKNLSEISLSYNDLTGWDFSGQNLTSAHLEADLSNADFAGADLTGAIFKSKPSANLTNANLTGANLKRAHLGNTPLTNADLTGAILTGAYISGLTKEQLYSTASYRQEHLQGIRINRDLSGWDFSGQNLTNAQLDSSTMTEANFSGANLQNAYLEVVTGLASAMFDANTAYNQCTVFPGEFDPIAAGLTLLVLPGDLDGNGELDAADVDLLTELTQTDFQFSPWLLDCNDARIDHHTWVKDLKHTWFGDADLNGEFDSSDFVQVFQAGKYEQGWLDEWGTIHNGAGWSEGDWNADGLFDSDDFITAFQDGGYEQGPRPDAAAVPESGGWMMLLTGFVLWLFGFRIHRAVS